MIDRIDPPRPAYLVGLIGAGIGPSLSPALHMREARHHGLDYLYRTIDLAELGLPPESIGSLLAQARDLGYDALNITHPCKRLVLDHLDQISPDAAMLGAVNTVLFQDGRAIGHNTDWSGFASSFVRGLPAARTDRVTQLGAGGAGAAVAHAILTLGADKLTVVDVDRERGAALAGELSDRFGPGRAVSADSSQLADVLRSSDGLIHATPTGMADHPGLPLPVGHLHPGLWVADIVYRPIDTALLQAARSLGCPTLNGGAMAVFQAADAFELITSTALDHERMLAHLVELVTRDELIGS